MDTALDIGNLLLTLALVGIAAMLGFILWDEVSTRRERRRHRDPE